MPAVIPLWSRRAVTRGGPVLVRPCCRRVWSCVGHASDCGTAVFSSRQVGGARVTYSSQAARHLSRLWAGPVRFARGSCFRRQRPFSVVRGSSGSGLVLSIPAMRHFILVVFITLADPAVVPASRRGGGVRLSGARVAVSSFIRSGGVRRIGCMGCCAVAGRHPFGVSARGDPRWPRLGSSMLSPRLVMRRSCIGLRPGRVFIETGFRTWFMLPPSASLQWCSGRRLALA